MSSLEEHKNLDEPLNALKNSELSGKLFSCEEALSLAGDSNWYQIRTTILLAIQWTIISFILQGQPFLFLPPKFACHHTDGSIYECDEDKACKEKDSTIYPGSANSLIVHFHLYCQSFSFDWTMFMVTLIISGIGLNPYSNLCFVLLSESAGTKYRQISSIGLLLTWGIGQIIFVPIAYKFRDWHILILYFISIPLTVQIITFCWIYESPKFYVIKKRYEEAQKVLQKISKVNHKVIPSFAFVDEFDSPGVSPRNSVRKSLYLENEELEKADSAFVESLMGEKRKSFGKKKKKIYTYFDLLRYKSVRKISILLCCAYFAIYLVYYGTIFALPSIAGNIYVNALILNTAEFTAYIVSNPIVTKLKRKVSFPLTMGIMSLSCLGFIFTNNSIVAMIILAIISKFGVAIGFSIVYVYTAELFPATVRSLGIGFATFVGKFGCAMPPILIYLFEKVLKIHPMVSFGIIGIIITFLMFFLQETKNVPMPDEIEEIIAMKKEKKKRNSSIKHK